MCAETSPPGASDRVMRMPMRQRQAVESNCQMMPATWRNHNFAAMKQAFHFPSGNLLLDSKSNEPLNNRVQMSFHFSLPKAIWIGPGQQSVMNARAQEL